MNTERELLDELLEAQSIRLHLGELSNRELIIARQAIRYAARAFTPTDNDGSTTTQRIYTKAPKRVEGRKP